MQSISDNHYFICKENATLTSNFFSTVRKRKSSLFGPDVTSNFREGLEKLSQESREVLVPPALIINQKSSAFSPAAIRGI